MIGKKENEMISSEALALYLRWGLSAYVIAHTTDDFAPQSSHFVDRDGWQAKIASIEFWIP